MKISIIVGARPNYMKAIPIYNEFIETEHDIYLVHTGQHYSKNLFKSWPYNIFYCRTKRDSCLDNKKRYKHCSCSRNNP